MTPTLLLLAALAGEPPPLADAPVPAGALQGPSSARLAAPVTVRFVDGFPDEPTPMMPQGGARARGSSPAPAEGLRTFTLDVARRHFEEAKWGKAAGKGRELVIRSVALTVSQGPVYNATVVVDRVQDGRRLGQATGQGTSWVDRSNQHLAAAFAGPFAGLAAHDASSPKARQDATAIRLATLRALDSALYQLAAYWSGEQLADEYRRQAQEGQNKGKK
ncbi:MAG: hypothetical protein HY904_19870 [Deltaproteobacteria bacterium]|nr:hypothetical protein [Deltaproteobacteria bacterium]